MGQKRSWLSRLFNPSTDQFQNLGQELVPNSIHNEYRLPVEGSIRDTELASHIDTAPEIDLNAKRNVIQPHTFFM